MINKTTVQGRLVEKPILKVAGNGVVCNVTIAWNRKYKNREDVLFLPCVFWNNKAEFLCNYFKKGQEIIVEGELLTNKWLDNNGNNRSEIKLNVSECHFWGNTKQRNTENKKTEPEPPKYEETSFNVDDYYTVDDVDIPDSNFPY